MTITDRIREKLTEALVPTRLEIINDSERHAGHAGLRDHAASHSANHGESHFRITVVSSAFEGKAPVSRHRMVYDLLKDELATAVHALCLQTLTPMQDVIINKAPSAEQKK